MAIKECNIVNKHVQGAIAMLEVLKEDSDKILPVKISSNANSERQTTFFSTKKRRQTPTTLSKPSRQDSNLCKSKIAEEPLFCGACFKENDSNHTNIEVSWIQWDICSMWLHLSCTLPEYTYSSCELCTSLL